MQFLRTTILALTFVLVAQPVSASLISDGSGGVFRPISNFTLDLSSLAAPQYSSIYIDAGITLTVLAPTGGAFAELLAANDIFVNGIIDAGSGNLGLLAGDQIMLGVGSQIIAGSLNVIGGNLINTRAPLPGGVVITIPGGDVSIGSVLPPSVVEIIGGTLSIVPGSEVIVATGSTLPSGGRSAGGQLGIGAAATIPEPSSLLLLLPGLILLVRGSWRRTL